MTGFAILMAFLFAGHVIREWTGVPLPANVIGMILFTAALGLRLVKLETVEKAADFLLRHMMLFFAPVVVGVVAFFPLIGREAAAFFGGLVISAVAVLLVTGWTTRALAKDSAAASGAYPAKAAEEAKSAPDDSRSGAAV
ncbi:MAG TPA: CidA/LrgA family protein [Paenibacillaceae bacterium]